MSHQINIGFETRVEDEQAVSELIRTCALRVLESEGVPFDAEIDVTVVDADEIRQLNAEYRDKDAVTDVLSFPMYEFLNGAPAGGAGSGAGLGLRDAGRYDFVLHARRRAGDRIRPFPGTRVWLSDNPFSAAPAGLRS